MSPILKIHEGDLPQGLHFPNGIAVDTETMGLNLLRDRLCLVQLSAGDGVCHLIKIHPSQGASEKPQAPHLKAILENPDVLKIFHFARFDVAALYVHFGIKTHNVFCTKIASKLARTYTERHGLKDLCKEILNVEISKQQQQSDWGHPMLSEAQSLYAATDVLHLHKLKEKLRELLERESRWELAKNCFHFILTRAIMDVTGFPNWDILDY